MLKYTPTTPTPVDHGGISGIPGETVMDDLWGEDIPTNMTAEWVQPHGDDTAGLSYDATDTRIYHEPVVIHAAIDRQPTDRTLKKIGIDKMKELLVTIPTPSLDDANLSCSIGDYLVWRGESYEVENVYDRGYWKNTNIFLYVVLNCKRMRRGS